MVIVRQNAEYGTGHYFVLQFHHFLGYYLKVLFIIMEATTTICDLQIHFPYPHRYYIGKPASIMVYMNIMKLILIYQLTTINFLLCSWDEL